MDLTKLRVGCLWKMKVERALWFNKAKWSAQGATFHRMDRKRSMEEWLYAEWSRETAAPLPWNLQMVHSRSVLRKELTKEQIRATSLSGRDEGLGVVHIW